ncbi:MAG: glycolate oxidase subunit GlcF, partial [Sulfuritalea sp.]|nr:glycolate oxidase subunit GlcF [Sulfuritalea sp.]
MQTHLADFIRHTPAGREAEAILRKCVHCGFCTATCPTYQLLGDELDGPRGRIYLMKQLLEGADVSARTQLHLDRCLTCRACETTCPSGVQYGRLVDIGRAVVAERVRRPLGARLLRFALREGLTRGWLFGPAYRLGQFFRPLLPASLKAKVLPRQKSVAVTRRDQPRRMLMLAGCVQPSMSPGINAATARVLDRLGIALIEAQEGKNHAGCCGAVRMHLDDHAGAREDARRNIDAWWPHIERGAEAVIVTASGCGAHVREYAHLLEDDPDYAKKAARVTLLARDVAEVVAAEKEKLVALLANSKLETRNSKLAFHAPCSLQHG